MVTLNVNGREIKAEEGMTILHAARENNIYIPTLCDNEAVAPYGACRLCLVEITTSKGRERLVASCLYQVEDGLTVKTDSERITKIRRMLIELLLARCPNVPVIQDLAEKLGVDKTRFKLQDKHCILCGLCVRACEEVVGVSAISLVSRGITRQMATPFYDPSDACIGCGSCAYVCPVDAIKLEDVGGTRTITFPNPKIKKVEFKLKKCNICGKYWAPEKQIDYIARISGTPLSDYDVCPDCRE